MAAELTKQHGKTRFDIAEPDLKALMETVNTLSTIVSDAQKQGSAVVDDEMAELLAELNIEPGQPLGGQAVSAIQGWATIDDDAEVVETLRLDAADDMAAMLAGARISSGCDEEDEMQMAMAVRTRGASAVLHRLIVSCHLTSASWNRQQMRVAMETRRSICGKQKWR